MYRIRIRTRTNDPHASRWIIGGTLFSKARANARVTALRERGHVVHLDLAEWHR